MLLGLHLQENLPVGWLSANGANVWPLFKELLYRIHIYSNGGTRMDAFNEVMDRLIASGLTEEEALDLINELFYEHASMPENQEELNLKH